ncbi:MAG: sugar kinase [Candidatus Diapherotrites archaeon]|uniref:Sugar kinase n=1 Tax=Candidatus Iainarchaeum sp. TaxID=3101447 RepID=A0A8T3YI96_9ARCH|nr:sugar kinase [Candidatus Diapherotrites archaeon]
MAFDDVKTPFGSVDGALGGSATYASLACSLFARPGIVSVVGSDFPEKHMAMLRSKGVDTGGIEVKQGGKTFHWKGEYGLDLNDAKTLRTDLNVLEGFKPVVPDAFRGADFLFLGNIDPELQLGVLSQMKKRPKLVVADTMNHWISAKRDKVIEVVNEVDIALMNELEARQLFRTPNLRKAAMEILALNSEIAIIKKGEHGCIAFTRNSHFACPGYPLENVLDPTGSGDCFGGALIGYLAKTRDFSERNMRRAIVHASCVASFNAEGFSVDRLKRVKMKDVKRRYSEFRGFVRF